MEACVYAAELITAQITACLNDVRQLQESGTYLFVRHSAAQICSHFYTALMNRG